MNLNLIRIMEVITGLLLAAKLKAVHRYFVMILT